MVIITRDLLAKEFLFGNHGWGDRLLSQTQEELTIRLQRAIERIRGVASASVNLGQDGSVDEVHALVTMERRPKQIVRDIETLLVTHFHMRVDYRSVSLVQLEPDDAESMRNRLEFLGAAVSADNPLQVIVDLRMDSRRYTGIVRAISDDRDAIAVAAAKATLLAIQQAINVRAELKTDDVRIVSLEDGDVCVAIITAVCETGIERLTGTCLLNQDACICASKAALDAVNRRLPIWIQHMI